MTTFFEVVVRCPRCGRLALHWEVASGNTLGATLWTDGHLDAPMLPLRSPVVRCPACGAISWFADWRQLPLDDPEAIELRDWDRATPEEPEQPPPDRGALELDAHPTLELLLDAIDAGICVTPRQETELRVLAWQRADEVLRRRLPPEPSPPPDPTADVEGRRANLEALVELLRGAADPIERLTLAEALRHLGRHADATAVLADPFPDELVAVADRIRSLARAGDGWPRPVWGPDGPAT